MKQKYKDYLLYATIFFSIVYYGLFIFGKIAIFSAAKIEMVDTTISQVPKQILDTIVDVKDKSAIFIGDSHTANHSWGWQIILCEKTGMKMTNTAVVGRHLPWMVKIAKKDVNNSFDYCFIYGGANDIHGKRSPYETYKDVQTIVDICNQNNVIPVVLTGFDAEECVRPIRGQEFYPKAYTEYQLILKDSIRNAILIDTKVVERSDCGDWTCHMNLSGHKKVAQRVIDIMKFKTF